MNGYKRRINRRSIALKIFAALLERWPLVLVGAFLISPIGPHMYWSGEYREVFGSRVYTSCTYIGSRGHVQLDFRHFNDTCPIFMWLDSRKFVS